MFLINIKNIKQLKNMFDKLKKFLGLTGAYPTNSFSLTPTTTSSYIVDHNTVFASTVVYSCMKVLSEATSSLPIVIKKTNSKTRTQEVLYDHPYMTLLNREVSSLLSSKNFFSAMVLMLKTFGNAYAFISRNGTTVTSLDLLYSPAVQPLILRAADNPNSDNDKLFYRISSENKKHSGDKEASEILHVADMSFDGISGKSSLQVAANAIGLSLSTEDFGNKFFTNGALISGFIKFPRPLRNDQREEYLANNRSKLQGLDNAHSIGILANGEEFQQIGHSPQDSQFIDTRRFQLEEITRVFGVPAHMVNDLTRATYSNIEMQSLEFSIYTLRPLLELFEAELNRKLFKDSTTTIQFNMDSLLRGDSKARAEYLSKLVVNGIINRDEARLAEGWNKIDGGFGADYLTQANLLTDQERLKKLNTA